MRIQISTFFLLILSLTTVNVYSQSPTPTAPQPKPEETEVWKPVPPVVTPGADCNAPPSDAIILFNGKNLDEWVSVKDKSHAKWIVSNGLIIVNKTAGNIENKHRDQAQLPELSASHRMESSREYYRQQSGPRQQWGLSRGDWL